MNYSEARDTFRDLLCTSLIGPGSDPESVGQLEQEQVGDFPLRRYYSGVLFPAPAVRHVSVEESQSGEEDSGQLPPSDFTRESFDDPEELDQLQNDSLADQGLERRPTSRADRDDVEAPGANQFFPSSLGLTACVPTSVDEVLVDVDFGLYRRLDPTLAIDASLAQVSLPERNAYDDLLAVPGCPARLLELVRYDDEQCCLVLTEAVRGSRQGDTQGDYALPDQLRQALRADDRPAWIPIMPYLYRLLMPSWQRVPCRLTITIPLDGSIPGEISLTEQLQAAGAPPSVAASLYLKLPPAKESGRHIKVLLANTSPFDNPRLISSNPELNACCFFQTTLILRLPSDSTHTLLPHRPPAEGHADAELRRINYIYQDVHSYGQGHSCAVQWKSTNAGRPPTALYTTFLPEVEVAGTSTELSEEDDPERQFARIGELKPMSIWWPDEQDRRQADAHLLADLGAFIALYNTWQDQQSATAATTSPKSPAHEIVRQQADTLVRLRASIALLERSEDARTCFRLANTAMLMQMVLSDDATFGKKEKSLAEALAAAAAFAGQHGIENPYNDLAAFGDHPGRQVGQDADGQPIYRPFSYRPFQLAFLLLNLPGIVEPIHPDRQLVDLLWFPTGGGKTEAYLALTGFTIAWRRLAHPHNGGGVAVLMRYTLRLLTAQQFERASRLICALEFLRQHPNVSQEYELGKEPIAIGMWVGGSTTPNRLEDAVSHITTISSRLQAANQSVDNRLAEARKSNVFAVSACPWCGSRLIERQPATDRLVHGFTASTGANGRFTITCQNLHCAFSRGNPLPIDVVDGSLYRTPPALLFGTVDKFAQLAHRPECGRLFGRRGTQPEQLPPDLIIQDELHLLNGPLGSVVGLFETAIELLATRPRNGQPVAPKLVASTATTRNTEAQIRALYGQREMAVFPPTGLRYDDSFFARAIPGKRKHLGFMPTGKTSADTQVRVMAGLLLQRARLLQHVYRQQPDWAELVDYYWTLVVYFNNLKDLGKTRNQVGAEIVEYLRGMHQRYHLDRHQYGFAHFGLDQRTSELTSRISSALIKKNLDDLGKSFPNEKPYYDPDKRQAVGQLDTVDLVLASNMLSVGIDVARFNLMLMVGQPKNVAEYIQASSRAAREKHGLVVNLLNPNRAREKSYFENYVAFNQAYYKAVEPLTATPYTSVTLDKVLNLVLVAYVRHKDGGLPQDQQAGEFRPEMVAGLRELLSRRISHVGQRDYALARLDELCANPSKTGWHDLAEQARMAGQPLSYRASLLLEPTKDSLWAMMTSLRDVDTVSVVETTPYNTYLA